MFGVVKVENGLSMVHPLLGTNQVNMYVSALRRIP